MLGSVECWCHGTWLFPKTAALQIYAACTCAAINACCFLATCLSLQRTGAFRVAATAKLIWSAVRACLAAGPAAAALCRYEFLTALLCWGFAVHGLTTFVVSLACVFCCCAVCQKLYSV